ncbi:hypothetical protein QE152_g23129 [Popillia japonica]|uniref:CCHC-type domain-containing protein n=1 Tax=Popillia japonica TaxID=7064 RepID=A0AAW1KIL9_POPJA
MKKKENLLRRALFVLLLFYLRNLSLERGIRRLGEHLDEADEKAVFQRRSSISRTPPQGTSGGLTATNEASRGSDKPKAGIDVEKPTAEEKGEHWMDEEIRTSPIYKLQGDKQRAYLDKKDSQSTKRKRIESPGSTDGVCFNSPYQPDPQMDDITKVVTRLVKKSHELRKLVGESTKTKLEIKRVVRELDHVVDNLEKKWGNYQVTESRRHTAAHKSDANEAAQSSVTQTGSKSSVPKITLSTVSTQTDWADADLERAKKDNETRENIKRVMLESISFQNLTKVIDMPWPRDIFTRTHILEMSPTSFNSEGDVAILVDPGGANTNKMLERLSMRYPAVLDMVNRNEGQVDYLTSTTSTQLRSEQIKEVKTTVYVLPLQANRDGTNDIQEAFNVLRELKEIYGRHPSGRLKLLLSDDCDPQYMRKICEYLFASDQTDIMLITSKAMQVPTKMENRKSTIERVIVKSGSTKYSDLLKSVKENVDLDRVGVQVKTIKRTSAGDLMLEVRGDRKHAGALKEAINKKINNTVSIINNDITLHVLDIDASLTKEAVERTLITSVGSREAQSITVKSMRPTRDGNQIATISASRATANAILKRGRIRIGWVDCRVRERIEVIRCFKCLEFGHTKNSCKGEDRSNHCLNCNQAGHQAKDCVNEQFCSACRERGHRADSTKCRKFRELLKVQVSAKKQSRNENPAN